MTEVYYKRWSDENCVRSFADKCAADFFASERRFLERILKDVDSVLDVGCASGRYVDLITDVRPQIRETLKYVGIDISPENIENARRLYPRYQFELVNALDFAPGQKFDLVNATGVCQHEPEFELLIERMLSWSARYVMFDVKLANVPGHVIDMTRSRAGTDDNPLYFILVSYKQLLDFLLRQPGVVNVELFGYVTPTNQRVRLPDGVEAVVSTGILIEKGSANGAPRIAMSLPLEILGR